MNILKKDFVISIALGLIVAVLLSFLPFEANCEEVKTEMLRMHIIANSDSDEDQALKLKVRNAVLLKTSNVFESCKDKTEAIKKANKNIKLIKTTAERVIKDEGYNYDVNVSVGKAKFSTRYYKSFTLPAGTYDALNIKIGKAAGHNFWCVMFPPLCVSAAEKQKEEINDTLSKKSADMVVHSKKYKVHFKSVEIYEKIKDWLD